MAENTPLTETKPFPWFAALIPPLLVLSAYWPTLHYDFVAWDDYKYIFHNPHFRNFDFNWVWTNVDTGHWIPLTWLSLYLDFWLGGPNPGMCHFTNMLLHAANTLLVFLISRRILLLAFAQTRPGEGAGNKIPVAYAAFLASLLFGLHPIHVESVTWITERKDVLSGFFFLSGLLVYLPHPLRPWAEGKRIGASLGLFLLALLSKSMAVTFPLVLFLLDAWPLRRLLPLTKKIILEKVPFLALSLAAGIVSIMGQSKGEGIVTVGGTPFLVRVLNAFHSFAFYLWKMAVPTGLCPFYPMESTEHADFLAGAIAGIILMAGTGWVCFSLRKQKPYLAIAWLYTVITLLPVLGFLQVGFQAAADRFTYLPSVGLFLLAGAWAAWALSPKLLFLRLFSILLAGCLVYGTLNQIPLWKNSVSLWESVVSLYPDSSLLPHVYLARAYSDAGRLGDSVAEYDRAITVLPPGSPMIHQEKGKVFLSMGRPDDAISEFKTAVVMDPEGRGGGATLDCLLSLWMVYEKKGMYGDALSVIQQAVKVDPHSAENYFDAGITYWQLKDLKKSEEAFNQAYSLDPNNVECLDSLASLYQKTGRLQAAADLFRKGIGIHPTEIRFYTKLADLDMIQGQYPEAVDVLKRAVLLQPQNPDIKEKLAIALGRINRKNF